MAPFLGFVKQHRSARTGSRRRLQLEALEERCVLSSYQGTYVGNYIGNTNQGPQNGSVQFTVDNNNNVTMTDPVSATGTVSSSGILQVIRPENDPLNESYTEFDGTFGAATTGFSGTWSVSFEANQPSHEVSGGGTWSASTTAAPIGSHFVVTIQPPNNVVAGAPFSLVVTDEDTSGNPVTSFNGTLTVALASNPGNSTLSGPLTAVANQGVATFSGLSLNNPGNGYTLNVFTSGGNSVTTSPFDVVAAKLVVTKIPSPLPFGTPFEVQVAAENADGTVDTTYNDLVSLQLVFNPGNATLSGTTAVHAVNGVAEFPNVKLTGSGTSVTVQASGADAIKAVFGAIDELGAYRPSDGSWSLDSSGGQTFNPATDQVFFSFSPPGVIGVAGDWTGSGTSKIGDFSNGVWHLDLNDNGVLDPGETFQFGQAGDQPVVGDWNGDGKTDLGVFRAAPDGITGEFILDTNEDHVMGPGDETFTFGLATDRIVIGDWDGQGKDEVGVFRDAASYIPADAGDAVFSLDFSNQHTFNSSSEVFVFGLVSDGVVIGDWNGSGTSKVGVYRSAAAFGAPGTALFSLDTNGSLQFNSSSEVFLYGLVTDQFVTGHWAKTPPLQPEGTPGTGGSPSPSPTANPFAGTYAGTFSGSGTAFGFTAPVSSGVNGTIDSNGNITVTNPGSGSGTVSATGIAHLTGTGAIGVANADYTFDGTFVQASDGTITGSGTWSATFSGGSASGTWQVSRQ